MANDDDNNWAQFDEYLRQGEPGMQEKAGNWQTAIGLQAVDGLKPSHYLIETARHHIEGDIDLDQVQQLLRSYYQSKTIHTGTDDDHEQADKAAANIAKILSTRTLAFNANGLIAVHRQIFDGVFAHAGKLRQYNISKKEWVLRGDSVNYLNFEDLRLAIDYDINQEKQFNYAGLTLREVVEHIARFVSGLWQIHPFAEGNTRATAVFTIQYLRSIGFDINNDMFASHSWYFRNALVRANYRNVQQGVDYDFSFLVKFFANLLMGEHNELRNRSMLINPPGLLCEDRTATEQVPNKYRTSSADTPAADENERRLISAIGSDRLSVKDMMVRVGLKHRPTFLANYLEPALTHGLVQRLYPDKPNHPRQRYYLTPQGHAMLTSMTDPVPYSNC